MTKVNTELLKELQWRGLIQYCSNLPELESSLAAGQPITVYCGFDPTAPSLHVGNLIPLITLARFQQAGHKVLALVGGATGLIGDPSGKQGERTLSAVEEVATRATAIEVQLAHFIDTKHSAGGSIVNNLKWMQPLQLIDFLRDVGKHFSIQAMLQRDSIKGRLAREGEGLSYTEFSYMLLQAYDFLSLHEQFGCSLQIGGSDQWGNMCSGADLIRRKHSKTALALTTPLLLNSNGEKFGKSAGGAIWLDPTKTSPWEFFQFWMNTPDDMVISLLKMFTMLSPLTIQQLEMSVADYPEARAAQRILATEVTSLVHGRQMANAMREASGVLFSKQAGVRDLSESTLNMLAKSIPTVTIARTEVLSLNRLLVRAGIESSMSQANKSITKSAAVSVNNKPIMDALFEPTESDWLHDKFLLLKKGKKNIVLVQRTEQ